ncbi:MAG: pitrilysin family protein [Candidatus Omnitrophica bacterium]|nr:pitrilysin family protein [Candidatus Omnitrophota bacterium]
MYQKTTLSNGLRIIAHPMRNMQSIALGIWINVGGRYESHEFKGISHYLEHLLFKGSKKYSCRKIKESLEGVGGSLNGFTSEELTCYLVKIPARHLDLALNIISDMAVNPLLLQEEIDKERTVILEEIKMYKDLPQSYVHELLDELLWPNQPLGMSIAGTPESVGRINRQDLALYQKHYYTPLNMVVSVCGKFNYRDFRKKVEHIFYGLDGKTRNVFVGVKEEQSSPQLKIFTKDTEQTHLALGFHGLMRDHPLRHALGILHIILGANMSSRLFNEVREKRGLAYEIATLVKRFQDTGAFLVHAGIDNRKTSDAVAVILKELADIKHSLVAIDEFKRAKEFYLGQLMLSLEDTLEHMLWIGESTATLNRTHTLKEIIREVAQLRREDIREAARRIFKNNNLNLALIGPIKDSQDKLYSLLELK